ncbi:MAG: hypothetical protein JRF50_14685 [Deltaproteobacteria bacterium]|nr:hypothetical protein [Deltaproteobacteria bacterium]
MNQASLFFKSIDELFVIPFTYIGKRHLLQIPGLQDEIMDDLPILFKQMQSPYPAFINIKESQGKPFREIIGKGGKLSFHFIKRA